MRDSRGEHEHGFSKRGWHSASNFDHVKVEHVSFGAEHWARVEEVVGLTTRVRAVLHEKQIGGMPFQVSKETVGVSMDIPPAHS